MTPETASIAQATDCIRVQGARTHNLRDIDIALPRDRLVVLTGPSGSGKSSLAFDTIYAEGQRQYIESLSPYARQFLHQLERPDIDLIEGLEPTISIDQRAGSHNPRSTVATVTEIYDYLRLLYARLGEARCHQCGTAIRPQSPEQIVAALLARPEGTRLMLLAPIVRGRKGKHSEAIEGIRKAGFVRARIDGEVREVNEPPEVSPRKTHTIEAVVDRLVIREGVQPRLAESVRLALRHGEGLVIVSWEERAGTPAKDTVPFSRPPSAPADGPDNPQKSGQSPVWRDELFSTLYSCPNCGISFEEIEPRTFSFNSPYGACPECEGLGVVTRSHAPASRSHAPGGNPPAGRSASLLAGDGDAQGLPPGPRSDRAARVDAERRHEEARRHEDVRRHEESRVTCPACDGSRLRPEARAVRIGDRAIHETTAMNVAAAEAFFRALVVPPSGGIPPEGGTTSAERAAFPADRRAIAGPILSEIISRLEFLNQVGLGYLALDRPAETLSGGELQRVRLASGLGSGLVGVCYVLDEPSIGLHPRDNDRLIAALESLRDRGNSVIVVEHDEAIMRRADWLVDLGPGAGRHGGQVVAEGTPAEVAANPGSLTGRYLSGAEQIAVPPQRRRVAMSRSITIEGAATNNLKHVTARFPLSALICVTGVSGSGKSSLLNDTLAPALQRRLGGKKGTVPICRNGPEGASHKWGLSPFSPGPHASLRGTNQIDKVVEIDQSPIGRTPRSNPATYTGVFDEIRKVFATTKDARARGYRAGRFSFNNKAGRCEECQGHGQKRIEMNFLPDLYVRCPVCEGKRFNRQTLEVRYRGLSIADVLDLSVDDAAEFFENHPATARMLGSLKEVGLGYLALGQSSITLSGGEAQRIKLAAELGRGEGHPRAGRKTFYILDEPTTGLHFDDTKKLLAVLGRLVDLGNTVVVIEHNVDVMKTADWIIDLGPEGGEGGGQIIAEGTPEQVAAMEGNETGRFLRRANQTRTER